MTDTTAHHPHFVSAGPRLGWGRTYTLRPFTGDEPEPWTLRPAGADDELWQEYAACQQAWERARAERANRQWIVDQASLVRRADSVWKALARARKTVDGAYAELLEGTDGTWRATINRLLDAHTAALAAAEAWDKVAAELAQARHAAWREIGESYGDHDEVARAVGVDSSGWLIWGPDDYEGRSWRSDTPMVAEVRRDVDAQLARIGEIGRLAGDRADR